MPDFRTVRAKKIKEPDFKSFKVKRDKRGGYSVDINWEYENDQVVGFKLYKVQVPKSQLRKSFLVSQLALEKLTTAKSSKFQSQILYDKNYFVENSKVKFDQEKPSRFRIEEKIPKKLNYSFLSFIRKNPNGKYIFTDKNVKFGNTYSYVLTAVRRDTQETSKNNRIYINIEDLEPPSSISDFKLQEISSGMLISGAISDSKDVAKYQVWRRKIRTKKFIKIFEGQNTQKSIALIDEGLIPGNEYEYKVYLIDFYNNISWSSPIKRIEFKSTLLSKGAIIDPAINISYDNPNILIAGERNSPKIVGYRIERQDLWKYEKKFEIKKFNEKPWPNVIFFDKNNQISLRDETAKKDRIYRYRVSSISLTGKTESIFVSPPVKPEEGLDINSLTFEKLNLDPIKINNFEANVSFIKQNPVFVELLWNIEGDWDFLNLVIDNKEKIQIDNIHKSIFYNKFKKGKQYKLQLQVFNLEGEMEESEIIRISI